MKLFEFLSSPPSRLVGQGFRINAVVYILLVIVILLYPLMGWVSWQVWWFIFFVRWTINIERMFDKKFDKKDE